MGHSNSRPDVEDKREATEGRRFEVDKQRGAGSMACLQAEAMSPIRQTYEHYSARCVCVCVLYV